MERKIPQTMLDQFLNLVTTAFTLCPLKCFFGEMENKKRTSEKINRGKLLVNGWSLLRCFILTSPGSCLYNFLFIMPGNFTGGIAEHCPSELSGKVASISCHFSQCH